MPRDARLGEVGEAPPRRSESGGILERGRHRGRRGTRRIDRRSSEEAPQGFLVLGDARTKGDRELEVTEGASSLAGAFTGQREREVSVVVGGIQLHGLGELPARSKRAAGPVEGLPEGFPDRRLLRLDQLRPAQKHRGLMGMAVAKERATARVEVVGRVVVRAAAIQGPCLGFFHFQGWCSIATWWARSSG